LLQPRSNHRRVGRLMEPAPGDNILGRTLSAALSGARLLADDGPLSVTHVRSDPARAYDANGADPNNSEMRLCTLTFVYVGWQ